MRRLVFISFILCLFWFLPVTAAEISIENADISVSGASVDYIIVNDSSASFEGNALIVGYDDKSSMLCYESVPISMMAHSKAYRQTKFNKELKTVKAFLWNNLDGMTPACTADSFTEGVDSIHKWNFADKKYTALGNITQVTEIDGLTFNYSKKAIKFIDSVTVGRCLYFYGGGKLNDCSVSFDLKGPCTLRVYASSLDLTTNRTIKLLNSSAKEINSFTAAGLTVNDYKYNGKGEKVWLMSASSGIYVYRIEVYYDKEPVNLEIGNIYTDNAKALELAIKEAEATGGGNIYIDTDYMQCDSNFILNTKNAGILISAAENRTPVLDFYPMQKAAFNTAESVKNQAFIIKGSYYTLNGFIIEKATGGGVRMVGEKSHNNTVSNVVTRYCGGSGIGIFQGAYNNTIKFCDSYRNCDLYTIGGNADGFQAGISAGASNKFINCRSWDNSDDGYDNFANYNDVTYIDCVAWNNGNPEVCIGLYDYKNGMELDENMEMIKLICKNDPNFKSNFKSGNYSYTADSFINVTLGEQEHMIGVADFIGKYWAGNPNAFKLGSNDSPHGPQVGPEAKRTLINCVAFEHIEKGIDRNGGIATIYLENCISYGNGRNYYIDKMTVEKFVNAIGFSGKTADIMAKECSIVSPNADTQRKIRYYIEQKKKYVKDMVQNNKIPGEVIFYPDL